MIMRHAYWWVGDQRCRDISILLCSSITTKSRAVQSDEVECLRGIGTRRQGATT
jgi:hypothetical protein